MRFKDVLNFAFRARCAHYDLTFLTSEPVQQLLHHCRYISTIKNSNQASFNRYYGEEIQFPSEGLKVNRLRTWVSKDLLVEQMKR